ncbi:MAG: YjbQ family protein [Tyzzerella sp.]|uniref:YjbQ family protein n=1 Tax=Candidatus Fimicola merdigallinarum TaxID=2840819 RepID=A0A9D9DUV9_9FIRM|nr:YjbQ family protein [Candidatus Fimicola merdigallinarum]
MVFEFSLKTSRSNEFINITGKVKEAIMKSGIDDGICVVFVPHTTAGVTVNENADPDVVKDMLMELSKIVPEDKEYRHFEGNSSAHIKASLMGNSQTFIVENGELKVGIWQGIYFTEFDGPRNRKFFVKVM